uniref:Ezrin-radixin-moesin-like protein n=1 Tax=Echinostoma caproni TaxID=27848 RepID=A0A183A060_9TREM
LIREEAMLQDRLVESRRRMEAIETENRVTQTRIDKVSE